MENIDLIAILLTIIAIFIAVFIFRRFLVIIAAVIILAVIGYFIIQNNSPNSINSSPHHKDNNSYLEKFKDHYCGLLYDKDDSLLCTVIVSPIYQDIKKSYSTEELNKMNKQQLTKIIIETAAKHKKQILAKLKKRKYLWEDFILDIKNYNIY